MSVTGKRDHVQLADVFRCWLSGRLPEARVVIDAVTAPKEGHSSETWFIDASLSEPSGNRRIRWVLRVQASSFQVYRDNAVERQYRVLEALAAAGGAPVPRPLYFESDPALLGAPFFVMERIEGHTPPVLHHSMGLFQEAAPADREAMWLSAIEAMSRVHCTDITPFLFLDRPALGMNGIDQELAAWDDYRIWADSVADPVLDRARLWLDDHLPSPRLSGLAWGDARPGNLLFRDTSCVGILDWETASLGSGESDLGWWLFYEYATTAAVGVLPLEGFGGREATIEAWEHFTGRKADAIDWHQAFAAWRYALIYDRAMTLIKRAGQTAVIKTPANPGIAYLRKTIG